MNSESEHGRDHIMEQRHEDVRIPLRLRVGITGHRSLKDERKIVEQVSLVLENLEQKTRTSSTHVAFTAISSLAEGADRLVARSILEREEASLAAVLPMPPDDYREDFIESASVQEFDTLLAKAVDIKVMSWAQTREESYEKAGREVVDKCHVLIAVWNGKPAAGRGGTAEIVEYARSKNVPVYWIHSDKARLESEENIENLKRVPKQLEVYNSEKRAGRQFEEQHESLRSEWESRFMETGFNKPRTSNVIERLMPHYICSDILAMEYQSRHLFAGTMLYVLASAAVAAAAAGAIFSTLSVWFPAIEVILMLLVLQMLWMNRRRGWHYKWTSYRFLAERLRSAMFVALAGIMEGPRLQPLAPQLVGSLEGWIADAVYSVWGSSGTSAPGQEEVEPMKNFLRTEWIEDQLGYHKKAAKRHHRRNRLFTSLGSLLFFSTLVVAAIHLFHMLYSEHEHVGTFAGAMPFLSVVLPSIGASIAAIRTQREYHRSAERSERMSEHLEYVRETLDHVEDADGLQEWVRSVEDVMLYENQDWQTLVSFSG